MQAGISNYQEPANNAPSLTIDGQQYGAIIAYTRYQKSNLFFHFSENYNGGSVDYFGYEGQGSITGAQNQVSETRILAGYDVFETTHIGFIPYAGFGYRNLHDNLQEGSMNSVYQAYFPLRVIQYLYTPIGAYFLLGKSHHGFTALQLEYDQFWHGDVTTHSFFIPEAGTIPEVTNLQSQGYGLRGALNFMIPAHHMLFSTGPYVRYWNINDSNTVNNDAGSFQEPSNSTFEIGAGFAVIF